MINLMIVLEVVVGVVVMEMMMITDVHGEKVEEEDFGIIRKKSKYESKDSLDVGVVG